jgi:hypothetical protein
VLPGLHEPSRAGGRWLHRFEHLASARTGVSGERDPGRRTGHVDGDHPPLQLARGRCAEIPLVPRFAQLKDSDRDQRAVLVDAAPNPPDAVLLDYLQQPVRADPVHSPSSRHASDPDR